MSASFADVRVDDGLIVYRTIGGPTFSTEVVTVQSGDEARDSRWPLPLGRWELGERGMVPADMRVMKDFFIARRGKAQGFRFRDWMDFRDDGAGVLLPIAGSTTTLQMFKAYASGDATTYRQIFKPVAAVSIKRDGAAITAAVDYTTGIVTVAAGGVLTWTGKFDIPVRFDTDQLRAEFIGATGGSAANVDDVYFHLQTLPIVELRRPA